MFAAEGNCCDNVFSIAWCNHADRDLTVIGTVCCVESAAAGIEADFTTQVATESGFESNGVDRLGAGCEGSG
jgi:hypothetical protein